jgi:hypothetical protein
MSKVEIFVVVLATALSTAAYAANKGGHAAGGGAHFSGGGAPHVSARPATSRASVSRSSVSRASVSRSSAATTARTNRSSAAHNTSNAAVSQRTLLNSAGTVTLTANPNVKSSAVRSTLNSRSVAGALRVARHCAGRGRRDQIPGGCKFVRRSYSRHAGRPMENLSVMALKGGD